MFKYPVATPKAAFKKFSGHSAHVTSVRFTHDDSYVISTGGGEKSIFQWRYSFDKDRQDEATKISEYQDENEEESRKKTASKKAGSRPKNNPNEEEEQMEMGGGKGGNLKKNIQG